MYLILENEVVVRVPPSYLGGNYDDVVREIAYEKLIGKVDVMPQGLIDAREPNDRKYIIVHLVDVERIGDGMIIHGDGAVYQKIKYKALVYNTHLHELVEGEIVDVLKFGAFVRFGPLDGLLHVSQVMDDRLNVDINNKMLIGKENRKSLKLGDKIRARVVVLNLNDMNPKESKVGLTMRQTGLGKLEWLDGKRKQQGGAQ